jgi:hypothetical protein
MTSTLRRTVLIVLVAFGAAVAGVFVGRTVIPAPPPHRVELHDFLHNHLDLDATQQARLETMEAQFAVRRRELEMHLRADNARLAGAIATEHGDGPAVRAAVDHAHATMGELQKATLAHIFAMRSLMRPSQAQKFDVAVTRALTADDR